MTDNTTEAMHDKQIALASELDIDLTQSIPQRMCSAAAGVNTAYKFIVASGLSLLSVKAECGHGEFSELCEKHGFNRQRASEAMRYATIAASFPKAKRNQLLELPKKKVLALASIEPETLEQALDDDDFINEISNDSYADLRERINTMQKKNADMAVELQTRSEREKELKAKLKNKRQETQLPDYVDIIRHESNAATIKINLACDEFQTLLNDVTTAIETGDKDLDKFTPIAAATLLIQARAAAARALQIYGNIDTHLSAIAGIDDGIPEDAVFTEKEMIKAIADRSDMVRDHDQEKIIRENERIAKQPAKRGAPKKPKKLNA